ncbi:MAG TPA: hypothetical protein VHK89_04060 [Actinomycetota bacterium]|nr:hypothetical protein [Actinomycetota bacterium]
MDDIHRLIAYVVPAGWALLPLWALVAFVRNKAPGQGFWNAVAVMQVLLAVQAVVGLVLLVLGRQPASNGPVWLHYAYGIGAPVVVLALAHSWARRNEGLSWAVFGVAGFVIFGLTFRALQTGLGID